MSEPYVKIDIINKVGYIEFFHPAHNSLPGNLLAELVKTELFVLEQVLKN